MVDSVNERAESFFVDVATTVFDDFFRELGARRESPIDSTIVRYSTDTWFADVLYLPMDGPNYSPRVEIGCQLKEFPDPRRNRVDVKHTAPADSEEYGCNGWCYRTRDEMKTAMTAVRDRILAVFALPFLEDTRRLQELLEHRYFVIETAWAERLAKHNDGIFRRRAEQEFKAKNYEKVIECYSNIPSERLSQVDELRLRIARKNSPK